MKHRQPLSLVLPEIGDGPLNVVVAGDLNDFIDSPPLNALYVTGTLTNTIGVLGILIWLGTLPPVLLVPVFSMNVPVPPLQADCM